MHEERTDDCHPLLLAARQLASKTVLFISQADPLQQVFSFLNDLVFLAPLSLYGTKNQILQDIQMGEELIALKDHANLLTNEMEVLFLAEDGLAIQ